MKKPLRLFTSLWGDKHIELFDTALVRSLCWPINRAALEGATWEIWTKQEDFAVVEAIAGNLPVKVELYAIDKYLADLETEYLNDSGVMMCKVFARAMRRCIDLKAQMLIAPPDTIFGGETIPNLLSIGSIPNSVVFVPHIRVHDTVIAELHGHKGSFSNATLVTAAMKHAHKSWTEAEIGHERINTFIGGIFWRRLANDIYAVQHLLPTPYLVNWTEEDYNCFTRNPQPGEWPPVFGILDHLWPSMCVFPNQRARVVASSDIAFLVEITDADKNVPPLNHYKPEDPDTFWRNAMHNAINRQIIATFRGE